MKQTKSSSYQNSLSYFCFNCFKSYQKMKAIFFLCLAGIICSVHGAGKYNQRSLKQVSRGVPIKNVVLEILQNPQRNICPTSLLFNKLAGGIENTYSL